MNLPEAESTQATIPFAVVQELAPAGGPASRTTSEQEIPGILFDRSLPAKFCPALFFFHLAWMLVAVPTNP
jgi:hypothetical protein